MTTPVFGICSWTLGIDDLEKLMSTTASMGLNAIQYCEGADTHPADKILASAESHNLTIVANDPFDCAPGEKHGDATLENAVAFYKKEIDLAARLGCLQTLQGLSAWTRDCKDDDTAWQFIVDAVQQLSGYAKEKDVPLTYEPCNFYEVAYVHTADEYQRLIQDSGCDNISVLLDSFHMNIGEKRPLTTLRQYGSRNSVFHISGSNREGIAQSNIDFKAYKEALNDSGFDGPCVFEFVLSTTGVNEPPRNKEEMRMMKNMVIESMELWKSYG